LPWFRGLSCVIRSPRVARAFPCVPFVSVAFPLLCFVPRGTLLVFIRTLLREQVLCIYLARGCSFPRIRSTKTCLKTLQRLHLHRWGSLISHFFERRAILFGVGVLRKCKAADAAGYRKRPPEGAKPVWRTVSPRALTKTRAKAARVGEKVRRAECRGKAEFESGLGDVQAYKTQRRRSVRFQVMRWQC